MSIKQGLLITLFVTLFGAYLSVVAMDTRSAEKSTDKNRPHAAFLLTDDQATVRELAVQLRDHQLRIGNLLERQTGNLSDEGRTNLQISGVYPHLTTYGVYSQGGGHFKQGHNECGIGAVVPWAGKLWMVNYAPHMPGGSEHKLYSIDEDLTLTIHPESVGGTPAARMIHRESNQLLIAHYLIDASGKVRVISPKKMPGRLTAIARHLTNPANMVYYIDMEGMIYEANVHTLETKLLFKKPVPGWHGKGGYTSQDRLVVSNNGEYKAGSYDDLVVGGPPQSRDEAGVLAEWDGSQWKIVERRQFTDVTGPDGIYGSASDKSPLWAIGWDRRSLRLKLLDDGQWHTFLLPKAAHNNDPIHGWYTEWPRLREIGDGKMMMDMHGMFFDFPKSFSAANTAGIRPIASHLRYVPDFCEWNGRLVLASDETSIQGNPLAGQPQSNLWFGSLDDLKSWGPTSAYGGPWVGDAVQAGVPSDPFLIAGFDRRCLHISVGRATDSEPANSGLRATDQQPIHRLPRKLIAFPRVTIDRGDWHQPAPGYSFTVDVPVTVYLAVDQRGDPQLDRAWTKTPMTLTWGDNHRDSIYQRSFPAGLIEIPGNATEHTKGSFGMPHAAFVAAESNELQIEPGRGVTVSPSASVIATAAIAADEDVRPHDKPIEFRLEIDADGSGQWQPYATVPVGLGDASQIIPAELKAEWMRIVPNQGCIATGYFHLTDGTQADRTTDAPMFAGLADVNSKHALSALLYPAKKNRNLQLITSDQQSLQFTKNDFTFAPDEPDPKLNELLSVAPEYTVDDASVILQTSTGRLRLPKGDAAFDRPFATGWPRGSREVESERHLANFHGTFYEVPLITNGAPPAIPLLRPVASHSKQIMDFCSWNGLLVLSGVRPDATPGGHLFVNAERTAGLWCGGVDDLWKLGKPVGRGGPWLDTSVQADEPSDAYLMTGYDKKRLTLKSDRDVRIVAEIDVDHQTGWHLYKAFSIAAGGTVSYEFPAGFSAHWIRFAASEDCKATAWLEYE